MPFVLDSSMTMSWHFEDERNDSADVVLNSLVQDEAIVPTHWWFEVRNVALLGERRGRTSEQDTTRFFAWLAELPIWLRALPNHARLFDLARRHRLTFYDAAYIELAKRERVALATLDDRLAKAAVAEGVPLVTAP
jgi:predicted nucleic acid-binding protein